MTVIVENGSGVFGANSYESVAYVTSYLTTRNRQTQNSWSTIGATVQAAAVVAATDHIENKVRGLLKGSKQHRDISTARATWTPTQQPADTETVVVGGTTYRFVTALAAQNDVLIGTSLADSIRNLVDAINGNAATAGMNFESTTVANTVAGAQEFYGDTMLVTSKLKGTRGNSVVTTTTVTSATWNFATLVGGNDFIVPQPLSFPRRGLTDRDGIPVVGMPDRLKFAFAEYAVRAPAATLAPDPEVDDRGGIITRFVDKTGPLTTDLTYLPGTAGVGRIPSYPAADRLLSEFLIAQGVMR